ncbi:MAG TPA: PKD domain-containing protein [Planctomycetota bacterium]|jgi:DNA-binding beta-propeller fold protein YncE|nr:PKD domain-containing protein [Planctomycetota bacterium]
MRPSFFALATLIALGGISYGTPAPAFTVTITIDSPLDLPSVPSRATTGQVTTFTASASGGSGGLTYQWDFGDGSSTFYSPANVVVTHTYITGGHFTVRVNVDDAVPNSIFATKPLTVHYPISTVKPTCSSTIILDSTNNRVWCVNPDQDTVSAVDASTFALVLEVAVGKNPRTLAQAADRTIWVLSQQHPSISILDPLSGALLHVVPLPHGSLPYGICMTPDGSAAYVSFQGSGGVTKISTSSRGVLATATNPPAARGISVTPDGRVFVTRFISPQSNPLLNWDNSQFVSENRGEVLEFSSGLGLVRTVKLVIDPGPGGIDPDFGSSTAPTSSTSRGVPNYITSMVLTPDGRRALIPSKKDNIQRGKRTPERDGNLPSAEVTYRAIVSSIDLGSSVKTVDELGERVDIDDSEMPQAACTSPLGDYLFVALQGNNRVQVRDLYNLSTTINGQGDATAPPGPPPPLPASQDPGLSPQGLVLDPATGRLFVHNYMGRTISVFDTNAVLNSNGGPANMTLLTVVGVIVGGDPADQLGSPVLLGKRVFYNASDPRMSRLGYISCAGCHLDGGSDMRVWDFTNRGEGFRNTVMLQGRGGTKQGNVHWSANFNEIQDFDNDAFKAFHDGPPNFAPPAPPSFTGNPGSPFAPLDLTPGTNNAGRDPSLDAMAAYVASLGKVSRSPFRQADGTLSPLGAAGEAVFKARDCQKCHKGREFTDSTVGRTLAVNPFAPGPDEIVLHSVGTIKPTSGTRLGGALPGIDTPTLKGVWQTAPYLHDGSAATLAAVMASDNLAGSHFGLPALTAQQQAELTQYMLEIDEIDTPPVPATQVNTLAISGVATGRPYSLALAAAGFQPFVDRSYRIATLPALLSGKVLLRTAEDDKDSTLSSLVTVTLSSAADVYVFLDLRAGANKPAWMDASWVASPAQDLFIGHATPLVNDLKMLAYKKTFAIGPFPLTLTLGGNLNGGATGALRNWFAIIDQAAAVFEEGPISRFEFVHDRDQDGDGLHDEYEAVSLLNPWVPNSAASTIPDEDKTTPGGATRFADQAAFETVPPPVGSGGSGGCGFTGLEPLALLALAAFWRRRPSR